MGNQSIRQMTRTFGARFPLFQQVVETRQSRMAVTRGRYMRIAFIAALLSMVQLSGVQATRATATGQQTYVGISNPKFS